MPAANLLDADYLRISGGALDRLPQDFVELGQAITAATPFPRNHKNAALRTRIRAWETGDG